MTENKNVSSSKKLIDLCCNSDFAAIIDEIRRIDFIERPTIREINNFCSRNLPSPSVTSEDYWALDHAMSIFLKTKDLLNDLTLCSAYLHKIFDQRQEENQKILECLAQWKERALHARDFLKNVCYEHLQQEQNEQNEQND